MAMSVENFLLTLLIVVIQLWLVKCVVPDSELVPYLNHPESNRFIYDDDEHKAVSLFREFKFLGRAYSSVYINGNGLMSFGTGTGSHNFRCSLTTTITAISAFMADSVNRRSDNTSSARLMYRQTLDSSELQQVLRDVQIAFPSLAPIHLNWMLVVTWHNIPPLRSGFSDLRNTFQAILTSDGTRSFVILYYNNITWPTMEAGMPAAQAGIFSGYRNISNTYLIPGSCTYSLKNIGDMSNIDAPGKFVFRVDEELELPSVSKACQLEKEIQSRTNFSRLVSFSPKVVPALGIKPLYVQGLMSLCPNYNIRNVTCTFESYDGTVKTQSTGQPLPGQLSMVCQKPDLTFLGKVRVHVAIKLSNGYNIIVNGNIFVVGDLPEAQVEFTTFTEFRKSGVISSGTVPVNDMTKAESLLQASLNLSQKISGMVNYTALELSGNRWNEFYTQKIYRRNETFKISFPYKTGSVTELETVPRAVAMSITNTFDDANYFITEFTSDVVKPTLFFAELVTNGELVSNLYDKACQIWYETEVRSLVDVLTCPDTQKQAAQDWRFYLSTMSTTRGRFNPLNFTVYMQSTQSLSGAAAQCVYTQEGNLVVGSPYGSRLVRYSPNNQNDYWEYYRKDVIPYMDCCLLGVSKAESCQKFFAKRPIATEKPYVFPVPFGAIGASQITNFDGSMYLLGLSGTFWLLKHENFQLQVLLERFNNAGQASPASVITSAAIVFKAQGSNKISKIQVSVDLLNGLLIWFDEKPLNFYPNEVSKQTDYFGDSVMITHNQVAISIDKGREVTVTVGVEISVKFRVATGNQSLDVIGTVPKDLKENMVGLVNSPDYSTASADTIIRFAKNWRANQTDFLSWMGRNKTEAASLDSQFLDSRVDILRNADNSSRSICNEQGSCIVDFQLTSNRAFAVSSFKMFLKLQGLFAAYKLKVTREECKQPNGILHGSAPNRKYFVGSTFQYFCDNGYLLNVTTDGISVLSTPFAWTCVSSQQNSNSSLDASVADQNTAWINLESGKPLSAYKIECVLSRVETELEIPTTPRTTQRTTPHTTTKKPVEQQPPEFVDDKFRETVPPTSQPNSEKMAGEQQSSNMGLSLVYLSTPVLWAVVIGLLVYIYRGRRFFKRQNNDGVMNLLDFDATGN